jgi:hypothetical protein
MVARHASAAGVTVPLVILHMRTVTVLVELT